MSAINAMFTISAYPVWGAIILILDVLVLYGLASMAGDRLDPLDAAQSSGWLLVAAAPRSSAGCSRWPTQTSRCSRSG